MDRKESPLRDARRRQPGLARLIAALMALLSAAACSTHRHISRQVGSVVLSYQSGGEIEIRNSDVVVRISPRQVLSVSLLENGGELTLNAPVSAAGQNFVPSDYVTAGGRDVSSFAIDYSHISMGNVHTPLGNCVRVAIPSRAAENNLQLARTLRADLCPAFPRTAVFTASYRNPGSAPVKLDRLVQAAQTLEAGGAGQSRVWTFAGASLGWGRDTVFPLPAGFQAENPMEQMIPMTGRNTVAHGGGVGGGLPVNDFWNGQVGVAIGHVEPQSVRCWMPVQTVGGNKVRISLETRPAAPLAPGATLITPRAFVTVHHGDFYDPLAAYSAMLKAQGVDFMKTNPSLYQPIWWTYAFGHNFRPQEVYDSIPEFHTLGIKWLIINNRWWDHYGDWMPRKDKFGSEAGFKIFIARLHQNNLKAIPWWMPYAVQTQQFARSGLYNNPAGRPKQSAGVVKMESATANVALQHPGWLIEDKQGKPVPIARNLAALCPAYKPARDYMVQLLTRMIRDWKVDGIYSDVTYIVPPCYNPAHHHASPYDSVRALASLYQQFRAVLAKYDPQDMLMICPCGTTINYCLLPDTNVPVTADPVGADQVRWRVKMYKALLGPYSAVFADRVESTEFAYHRFPDGGSQTFEAGEDFASGLGTGGIVGTIFIWPRINKLPGDLEYRGEMEGMKLLLLTPAKAVLWKKWFGIYHQKMLSDGEFLNLYTVGFDHPEGYAIRKGDEMYYAFFAAEPRPWGINAPPVLPPLKDQGWQGNIELRGLNAALHYQVTDYEHGKDLGGVSGSNPRLSVKFTNHLLLEVTPK